jgi:hypothetical protein
VVTAPPHSRRDSRATGAQSRARRMRRVFVGVAAGVAAIIALASAGHPTGLWLIDVVYLAGWAVAVVLAASIARRWTWVVAAGCAAFVVRDPVWTFLVFAALALAVASVVFDFRSRVFGALVGLGVVAGLMHGGHGRSELLMIVMVAVASIVLIVSGVRNAPRKIRKRSKAVASAAAIFVAATGLLFAIGLVQARNSLERALADANSGIEAARSDDPEGATVDLHRSSDQFSSAHDLLRQWWAAPAQLLPGVRQQVKAVEAMAAQGAVVADASSIVADATGNRPLSFKAGAVDLTQLNGLAQPLADLETKLQGSQVEVGKINEDWLLPLVTDRKDRFSEKLDEAVNDADLAREVVRVAPTLLGGDRPRHYLVAFTTPDEARGRTGFMGDYGEFVVDKGRLDLVKFGRTTELERSGGAQAYRARHIDGPPDYVARYGQFAPAQTLRNIQMSPDFPSVASALEQVYPQTGGPQLDGVINLDVDALAGLLRFTGPVQIPNQGIKVDTNSARDFFLSDQYKRFTDNEQRQQVLDEVVRRVFDKLTHSDLPVPSVVAKTLGPLVDAGHLAAQGVDPSVQHLFERLGVSGAMSPVQGDYLAITDNNAGGNKTDLFLSRTVKYNARFDPTTGHVTAGLDLDLHNAAPSSGLPDYIIGNSLDPESGDPSLPPGTNRTWVSIYSPLALKGATLDGQPLTLTTGTELGRYVYSAFMDIPSNGDRKVHLDLEGNIAGPNYRLDIDHQPLVIPDQVNVAVALTGPYKLHPGDGMTLTGDTANANGALEQNRTYLVTVSRT